MSELTDRAERAAYLANVLSIAKVNGRVTSTESLALRSIVKRIGASQKDLVAAGKLLSSGRYSIRPPQSMRQRMENLQDMVMVAMADGEASSKESDPIERLASSMHYSQADIDLAVRRAELALRNIGRGAGTPEPEPDKRFIPPPIPTARRRSSSSTRKEPPPPPKQARRRSWRNATEAATQPQPPALPTPDLECDRACQEEVETPPVSEVRKAEQVPQSTESLERPPLEQQDPAAVEAPPEQATPVGAPPTSAASRFAACAACRAASESPVAYCFGLPDGPMNPWGCRLSGMTWSSDVAWLALGHFRDEVSFVFDKQAIADRLAANLASVLDCPHLDTAFTEAAFDCFPSRAAVGPRWDYQRAENGDANVADVTVTEYIHGCAVSSKASVAGVNPIGIRGAIKIVRDASRRIDRRITLETD